MPSTNQTSPRIVLVNPPQSPGEQAGSFRRVAHVIPPLGLASVAAVLERDGFPVGIVDCPPLGYGVEDLAREISKRRPDVVGFTATVASIGSAIESAKCLRARFPGKTLLVGGPHVTTLPEEVMGEGCFDYGVLGEGEATALDLMRAHREGRAAPDDMPGLVRRQEGGSRIGPARPLIEDLDALPLPARHLLPDLGTYKPMIAGYRRLPFAQLVTSRGCPFRCVFCDRAVFGNRYRARSAGKVADELEELARRHGAREVKFYDDFFTCRKERIHDLCDEIARRGLDLTWTCSTRVDGVDEALLGRMKSAGCWQIDYGLESGDPRMLEGMGKGATLEQAESAVRATKRAGLEVRAYFVLGLPGETKESMRRTLDFAIRLGLDVAAFYALAPYPGTDLFARLEREGKLAHHDYAEYRSTIDLKRTRLAYVPEGMTEEDFKNELGRMHRRFYLRPGYLLGRLRAVRTPLDLKRYGTALRAILTYGS